MKNHNMTQSTSNHYTMKYHGIPPTVPRDQSSAGVYLLGSLMRTQDTLNVCDPQTLSGLQQLLLCCSVTQQAEPLLSWVTASPEEGTDTFWGDHPPPSFTGATQSNTFHSKVPTSTQTHAVTCKDQRGKSV
ncbi:hypothetical protein EYF80_020211 [Liparis tanakae]|uniref:Uncharacterized protein n=1 Tax=Liparis tanakae TaxID=230148 RepID=A0A4Z2HUN6_9TELE|nr:hypothetical protein EYF80_020211 [Liparis tanakae]